MGSAISKRLVQAGYTVIGTDSRQSAVEAATEYGLVSAKNVEEVARECRIILLSLPQSSDVEDVCLGERGILHFRDSDGIIIDLTSGDPNSTRQIATALLNRGLHLVDAAVSGTGGPSAAIDGTLTVLAGGEKEIVDEVWPLLRTFGSKIFYMGPVGSGHLAKSLNQFLFAANMLATSEVIVLGRRAGLDPSLLCEAIQASSGRNFATEHRFPQFVLKGDDGPDSGGPIRLLYHNLDNVIAVGRKYDYPMPIGHLLHELVTIAVAQLGANATTTSVVRLYEEWAKTSLMPADKTRLHNEPITGGVAPVKERRRNKLPR
jgi:3-hydroxyisobutyrate dehydrogenase-like beta-hydroxyacid dehydrogenase